LAPTLSLIKIDMCSDLVGMAGFEPAASCSQINCDGLSDSGLKIFCDAVLWCPRALPVAKYGPILLPPCCHPSRKPDRHLGDQASDLHLPGSGGGI
jgi:hypothetical protein